MCQHVLERLSGVVLSTAIVIGVGAASVFLWPDLQHSSVTATYAILYALVVAQVLALPTLRCFSLHSTAAGCASATHTQALFAVAGAWWLRYTYECEPGSEWPSQEHLLRYQWVRRTAHFSTIVAALSMAACAARWVGVALSDRRVLRRRRQAAMGARRLQRVSDTEEIDDTMAEDDASERTIA